MKIINPDTGFLIYQKIFKHLLGDQSVVVVWQINPQNGKRQIQQTKISALHLESGTLSLELQGEKAMQELPLYCYAESEGAIFKTTIHETHKNSVVISIPQEIRLIEGPDAEALSTTLGRDMSDVWRLKRLSPESDSVDSDMLVVKSMAERSVRDQELLSNEFGPVDVDEEEKLFGPQRESPRARPKAEKLVKVSKVGDGGVAMFRLFDLSRGGMSFISHPHSAFHKGDHLHILGFKDFDLDDPLVGTIMSIRPFEGHESDLKVGVKFLDGQD
jgi:hypothetical protein